MIQIVSATPAHVREILLDLRAREEDTFGQCPNAEEIILDEIHKSTAAFSGFIDDKIACLWGIQGGTILSDMAELWLITTRLVEKQPFIFVRHSQIMTKNLLKDYSCIYGYVLESNEQSVKWLRWLGCQMVKSEDPSVLKFSLRRA